MQRILFFLLLAFGSLCAASVESEACGKEIQLIDKQVQKLEQQKKNPSRPGPEISETRR